MIKIGQFLYLVGIILTAKLGYAQQSWYYLFAGSILLSMGWGFIRSPQLLSLGKRDGAMGLIKILSIQIVLMSVVWAPIFFAAKLFG